MCSHNKIKKVILILFRTCTVFIMNKSHIYVMFQCNKNCMMVTTFCTIVKMISMNHLGIVVAWDAFLDNTLEILNQQEKTIEVINFFLSRFASFFPSCATHVTEKAVYLFIHLFSAMLKLVTFLCRICGQITFDDSF